MGTKKNKLKNGYIIYILLVISTIVFSLLITILCYKRILLNKKQNLIDRLEEDRRIENIVYMQHLDDITNINYVMVKYDVNNMTYHYEIYKENRFLMIKRIDTISVGGNVDE